MRLNAATAILLLLSSAGCAAPAGPVFPPIDPPLVWPAPPDAPRIRFLGTLSSSDDLKGGRSAWDGWNEALYGPTSPSRMIAPNDVVVDGSGDRVAVADPGAACVHVLNLETRAYQRIDSCEDQSLLYPVAVAWIGRELWLADAELQAVCVDAVGASRLIGRGAFVRPGDLALGSMDGRVYVSDTGGHCVVVLDRAGQVLHRFGSRGAGQGEFNFPSAVACAADGVVAIADSLNFRVQMFTSQGVFLRTFGSKGDATGDFSLPKGIAFDGDGGLWVVDGHFENVQGFTRDGLFLMAFGAEGRRPGEFWLPRGVFIDGQRRIWVADTYNRRIQVFEFTL